MAWYIRIALALAVCSSCLSAVMGQEPLGKPTPKAKVELRWVESNWVKGLTEDKGFQSSCDPNDIMYVHKKTVMVLTTADVTEARLSNLDLSKNGLASENYMVTLHLTKEARGKLAAACGKEEYLTVLVDGKHWGVSAYDKRAYYEEHPDEKFPATPFAPVVGFCRKAEAERLVDAFK